MTYIKNALVTIIVGLIFSGCGAYFNQPVKQKDARTGELTPRSEILKDLPVPAEPVVVGVYNFKDQTGQYKSIDIGNTFSTAIPQGSTAILLKALEDSKWFSTIERENFANLLNERNIIRTTRSDYSKNNQPNQPNLPPLLYAGILLEGGVVSYDSNIITGGMGARYFGIGGSTQYREDRITVYLRAVSTSNGRILKTVYVSKTILSQAVSASMFRYVSFQRLMEAETGFTKNEPVQLALKDAIETAVEGLIIEGIESNLWSTKDGEETNKALVEAYKKEKEEEEATLLYHRKQIPRDYRNKISAKGGFPLLMGDYSKKRLGYGFGLGYSRGISDYIDISASGEMLSLEYGNSLSNRVFTASLNADLYILPYDILSPYVYGGGGIIVDAMKSDEVNEYRDPVIKVQFGLGAVYSISDRIGIKFFAETNITFTDELDYTIRGKWDDYYYNVGIGINYNFGKRKAKSPNIKNLETIEQP